MVGVELCRVLQSTSKTVGGILSLKSTGFSGAPHVDAVPVEHNHTHVPAGILPGICTAIGFLEFTLPNCQQAISLHIPFRRGEIYSYCESKMHACITLHLNDHYIWRRLMS